MLAWGKKQQQNIQIEKREGYLVCFACLCDFVATPPPPLLCLSYLLVCKYTPLRTHINEKNHNNPPNTQTISNNRPWLDACVEAELLKAGQNINFLRARKVKRNKDALRRQMGSTSLTQQLSSHAGSNNNDNIDHHHHTGTTNNGGASVNSGGLAENFLDMFDSSASHQTPKKETSLNSSSHKKHHHQHGASSSLHSMSAASPLESVSPGDPHMNHQHPIHQPQHGSPSASTITSIPTHHVHYSSNDDHASAASVSQVMFDDDSGGGGGGGDYHDGNDTLEVELEDEWEPEGGWSRWARLFVNARKGKRRSQLTFEEERCLDARLLGRLPTLMNHLIFHYRFLTYIYTLIFEDSYMYHKFFFLSCNIRMEIEKYIY
jgi:hypothetical protein